MAVPTSQRVRIVSKIRALTNPDAGSVKRGPNHWISVHRPEDGPYSRVRLSFKDQVTGGKQQQQSYEVDECYGEDGGNGVLFEKEILPLIGRVFEGRNTTVFAYGAKGSGKTFTFQGNEEEPGLVEKAMAEILSRSEEAGRSVSVSLFEVHLEQVVDLLDPKRSDVSVFEDAQGKIRIKGLHEVDVKSVTEFRNLYFSGTTVRKPLQKIGSKPHRRSHRGLVVRVLSSSDEAHGSSVVGKMNFIDLAGYEDPRKKDRNGSDLFEITRNNKSLYAVQNVVHALSASWVHVPYRESKLTRILQDSLGGMSHVLMVACMNQFFSEDAIKALSLASRSCQASKVTNTEFAKRGKGTTKPTLFSSIKSMKSLTSSVSIKKQARSLKVGANSVIMESKGRGLFQEENQVEMAEQETSVPPLDDQASQIAVEVASLGNSASRVISQEEQSQASILEIKEDCVMPTPITHHTPVAGVDKENKSLMFDKGGSPPLSARLRDLSNTLKSLCTATKFKLPTTHEDDGSINPHEASHESSQPVTPTVSTVPIDLATPQEKFHTCNSRLKESFVESHLKFLNTASKEELKQLKGIGEKRAAYIIELRNQTPQPFKNLEDLESIGLSSKQIKGMMKKVAEGLF